jgi:hypothetical protein
MPICHSTFIVLKKRLVETLILVRPNFNKSFILDVEYSIRGVGVGVILSQKARRQEQVITYVNKVLHPKPTTSWLVHILEHPWCWDKPWATRTHWTHCGLGSGEATTFPHIVFSVALRGGYIRMTLFFQDSPGGVPKLSWFGLPGLWAFITSCSDL